MKLILTCEHAGNEVPEKFQHLFAARGEVLNSHRGYDPGAYDLFNDLKELADFSHFQNITRLLVETNRSLHHPNLFSGYTKVISPEEKKFILKDYYFPYRNQVENQVAEIMRTGEKVFHLSVHSFTPELNGEVRNADIGLLYDPSRSGEREFCTIFKQELLQQDGKLKIRFNYPYRGKADGFTTYLRRNFPRNYIGVELEVNQKFVKENKMQHSSKRTIIFALEKILKEGKHEIL